MQRRDLLKLAGRCCGVRALGVLACALASGVGCVGSEASLKVQVDKPGFAISPMLWGIFFEDINHSADGGLYAELVRNISFEDGDKLLHWKVGLGDGAAAEPRVVTDKPLNPFNRRNLELKISDAGKGVRLENAGYWGMSIAAGESYTLSLWARAGDGFEGGLSARLESPSGQVLATGAVENPGKNWEARKITLKADASHAEARLVLEAKSKGTLWLDMVSLMPSATWKEHGFRPDLAEMLNGLKPAFVRFPGGCWVEGNDMAKAYRWKDTIGDRSHRRPLFNIWDYYATHGIGYHEYLQLCEDLGAEPLFVINCGMSHTEVVPMDQMANWLQDALDAVEYANGPTNTVWGALRAANGHPAPFALKYMEIGNENGGPAYATRYEAFVRTLRSKYPEITLVANDWGGVPTNAPVQVVDEHYYNNPEFFIGQAGHYDRYDRKGPKIYVGEYAVTSGCGEGNLRAAVGEAAFMTGMERNSDVVIMASYAPLFVNVNHRKWNPDLINFNSSRAYGIPSYFAQKMFAENRADVVLPVEVQSPQIQRGGEEGGGIGVGTWMTRAEYKDIKVESGGRAVYSSDFSAGTAGWRMLSGEWKAQDGAMRQSQLTENVRAVLAEGKWKDYTLSLKARKLGGEEGFLILFNVQDDASKSWWNIGGWGNKQHAIEMGGISGRPVNGSVETGRWYDIRVEVLGRGVKCFLDGKLIHEAVESQPKALYASAGLDKRANEIVLKIVNASYQPLSTRLEMLGLPSVASEARLIELTSAKATDENSLKEPNKVSPVTKNVPVGGPAFDYTFAPNSINILRLKPR